MQRVGFKYEQELEQNKFFSFQSELYEGENSESFIFPDHDTIYNHRGNIYGGNLINKYSHLISKISKIDAQLYFDYDKREVAYLNLSKRKYRFQYTT